MNTAFDLTDKIAIVTGGSRGLGLGIAHGLANAGTQIAMVARSKPTQAVSFDFTFFQADLGEVSQRAGLVEQVASTLGQVDILFHCAGQQHREAAVDFSSQQWSSLLELHLTAAMDLSQQAARHMLPRQQGKIVLLSSIIGFQGGYTVPAYSAAKHAVIGLVQSLANEWAAQGINVNALAPGYFDVGIGQDVLNDAVRGPQIKARIPAGRAGSSEDIEGAAVFLASRASDYIHGHTLVVDGGWLGR